MYIDTFLVTDKNLERYPWRYQWLFLSKKSGNTVVSLGAFSYYFIHFHVPYFKTFYTKHIIFIIVAIFKYEVDQIYKV